jgi:hypothetical protein
MGEQTVAAFLQLAAAALFLLIGALSSNVYRPVSIVYEDWGYTPSLAGSNTEFTSLFLLTILPLTIGTIGLVLSYGLWMSKKKTWNGSLALNLLGILVVLFSFPPVFINLFGHLPWWAVPINRILDKA